MTEKMTIRNIGPIHTLEIPIPEEGGLVVLRGGQGHGKSTAIKSVQKLLGEKPKGLSTRDGQRSGKLEFGEVRLTVHRSRSTRKGSLEICDLESQLDIGRLIDPGYESDESADAARIKALIAITGVKADKTAYYELAGGESAYDELGVDDDTEDPLLLAKRVKTALEKQARSWERNADTQKGHAQAAAEQAQDVDTTKESDRTALQTAYDAARDEQSRLAERQKAYTRAQEGQQRAQEALDNKRAEYAGKTVDEATQAQKEAQDLAEAAQRRVRKLKDELKKAEGTAQVNGIKLREANADLQRAHDHVEDCAVLEEVLKATLPEPIAGHVIEEAQALVQQRHEALEQGVLIRDAKDKLEEAQKHTRLAQEATHAAEVLREKARDVDNVLSQALPKCALRIEGGRLVTATDRSQSELFAELSDGERTKMAIQLAAKQLPPHGILCISQQAYEGQQPANKAEIDKLAKELKIVILAAEATDDELHAREFSQ